MPTERAEGPNAPTAEHGVEYRERGVVTDTFPLADADVVSRLIDDVASFDAAVMADREAGRHRVPYRITDAIREVAHDDHIVGLVEAVLGSDERWVMWGSNIQSGTPNQAGSWHVDLESRLWPSITVAVGLAGCTEANSTSCIPYSHELDRTPAILRDQGDRAEAIAVAAGLDPRCRDVVAPVGFATGRFYAFNARIWHSGEISTSSDRVMLFMHYQRARDRRVPLMLDYAQKRWADEAAPYLSGPSPAGIDLPVNTEVHRPPSSRRRRIVRRLRRAG